MTILRELAPYISCLAGIVYGLFMGIWLVHDRAVDKGVAEYYIDRSHTKRFRWLPPADKGESDANADA